MKRELPLIRFVCVFSLFIFATLGAPVVYAASDGTSVLPVTEVLRLTDESGLFVFKRLDDIRVNGSLDIFVSGDKQILQFDAKGQYKGNLIKIGEGPGEVKYVSTLCFDGSSVLIGSLMPIKVIRFDQNGKLLKELKIDGLKPFTNYIFSFQGGHYFLENKIDFRTMKTGVNTKLVQLVRADDQAKLFRTPLQFETLDAVINKADEQGRTFIMANEITRLLMAFDGRNFLYVSTGDRYGITQIDMKTQKIVKNFKRDFVPVPYKSPADMEDQDKEMEKMAGQTYFNDIWALRSLGDDLMVFTSQIDAKKGVLVDRFNADGRRIASYYLTVPGVSRPDDLKNKALFFEQDYFWTSYIDDEDNPVVVKYRIDWPK